VPLLQRLKLQYCSVSRGLAAVENEEVRFVVIVVHGRSTQCEESEQRWWDKHPFYRNRTRTERQLD
jgi:hypothetical protein